MASIPPTLCTISHTNAQPVSPHKSACGKFGLSGTIIASEVQRSESRRSFELWLLLVNYERVSNTSDARALLRSTQGQLIRGYNG